MNKKKILAELVGYLVRKEFTIYEVLDAYYAESERHFFEDELPETIPSEEQKEPDYKLEPLPCRFEGQRELTQNEINQAITDVNRIFENKALQINAEKEPAVTEPVTLETPAETKVTEPVTKVTEPETLETPAETKVTEPVTKVTEPVTKVTEPETLETPAETKVTEPVTKVTEPVTLETPAETKVTEPVTKVTEPVTLETPAETKGTVINGDYTLKDVHKMYRGTFYENVKDFILDGKTIDEHLKENNILPVRFYDRMNSKGWTIRKAATTPINAKYDYSQIMPNGKTIMQNLNALGLGKNTFCYRVRRGYSLYEACTISEYDMRSKQTTKGVRAWKKNLEEKLKAENEIQEQPAEAEQEPKQESKRESKKKLKKEPKQESKREYILDDPPAKNVVPSSIPDLTIVDICQNMKISVKRLKDRIDKGTFPKPDKGNKWSYAAVRFYFPNWG